MQAVIFDLDGVLIDSEVLWDEVRRALADGHGVPWPDVATRAMQGMSTPEWSRYLVDTVGVPGPAEAVAEQVIAGMADRYASGLPVIDGAVELVARLAGVYPLGLASSSPRRLIDDVLATPGFAGRFAASVSSEEVAAGKPDPAVYLEAARRLGIRPQDAVAIEDSSNGLRAAHAAGMRVIAVPNSAFPPAPDALALASVVVTSLDEITADVIDR